MSEHHPTPPKGEQQSSTFPVCLRGLALLAEHWSRTEPGQADEAMINALQANIHPEVS